jgi:hypothetical protein
MRRSCFTKFTGAFAGLLASFLFAGAAVTANAQVRREAQPYYDVTKEITISGTVASVATKEATHTIPGPHLVLTTASGEVDASLGVWGMRGKGSLAAAPGDAVEVTGVMKTLHEKQIFVARTVKMAGEVYTMRNEHGIPVSPQTRERLAAKTTQKGDSL